MENTFDDLTNAIHSYYEPSRISAFIGATLGKVASGVAIGFGIAVGLAIARAAVGL